MTNLEWDYSELAASYDKRAEYSSVALDATLRRVGLAPPGPVADIGAGTGKLSRPLATRRFRVFAVEPNDEMRKLGIRNTAGLPVTWSLGTGEETGLQLGTVRAAFFGSSFNVVNQANALRECARILCPQGWFCCMWNHRDLEDPLQARIERVIKQSIAGYDYGKRREDPSAVIRASGLFEDVEHVEDMFVVQMPRDDVVEAWRSHATLARQAGDRFPEIIDEIGKLVPRDPQIPVPYTTRSWFARLRPR